MFKELFTEGMGRGWHVYAIDDPLNSFTYSKPELVIAKWVELQKKYPMSVEITALDKRDVKEFYTWIHQNTEQFIKIVSKQKTYKTDYLYKETQVIDYTKISYENDGLHPFTVG